MNNATLPALLSLALLLGGCTTVQRSSTTLSGYSSVLTPFEISAANLDPYQDDVYLFFDASGCPRFAYVVLPQCRMPIGDAICRGELKQVKFKQIRLGGGPSASFGITFDTPSGFDPCSPSIGGSNPGTKVCNIAPESSWPVADMDLIIKYNVTTPAGCSLDPYLVLTR